MFSEEESCQIASLSGIVILLRFSLEMFVGMLKLAQIEK